MGQQSYQCRVCGRALDNPKWVARGIGPRCFAKTEGAVRRESQRFANKTSATLQPPMFWPDYTATVERGALVLTDNKMGPHLTNAMAEVLRREGAVRRLPALVVYRDETDRFDGVLHARGRFVGFYPLRTKDLDTAITRAKAHLRVMKEAANHARATLADGDPAHPAGGRRPRP